MLAFVIAGTVLGWVHGGNIVGTIVMLAIVLFLVSLLYTRYRITADGRLVVRCGMLPASRLPIAEITAVAATHNPLSAPALSFDRLEIYTGKGLWNIISPERQQEFIESLQAWNPRIEVRGRKKPAK